MKFSFAMLYNMTESDIKLTKEHHNYDSYTCMYEIIPERSQPTLCMQHYGHSQPFDLLLVLNCHKLCTGVG